MSAKIVFSRRAKAQIQNLAGVANQSPKAAREFLDALDVKAEQLAQFPESGQVWEDDVRRMLLRRVPYSVFSIFDDKRGVVTIIACYHDKSDPQGWSY